MIPDFTNLDPSLIASYWIYFFGSLIVGMGIGVALFQFFFRREKKAIKQERKNSKKVLEELEEVKGRLAEREKELNLLKAKIANNELYWNEQKHKIQEAPGDRGLYNMLRKIDSGKD